jgi:hypothetical protein
MQLDANMSCLLKTYVMPLAKLMISAVNITVGAGMRLVRCCECTESMRHHMTCVTKRITNAMDISSILTL